MSAVLPRQAAMPNLAPGSAMAQTLVPQLRMSGTPLAQEPDILSCKTASPKPKVVSLPRGEQATIPMRAEPAAGDPL